MRRLMNRARSPRSAAVCRVILTATVSFATIGWAAPLVYAQNRNWPSEAPPRPLSARQSAFPDYEIRTLENGLQVVAVLHHEQPVISMRMIVRAGAAQDPPDKAGLADLAASLLDQGTTTKSAKQVQDEIDFMGGAMGAGAATDLSFVNVVVMKDNFEAGLRILSDMARKPGFAPEEIERQRQQALSAFRVNLDSPEYVADVVFDRLVYGSHPYGYPQKGTAESIASIARADLIAYHDRYFVPNNAILAVVGDLDANEAFSTVQKVFGDWQRGELPAMQFPAPPEPARRVVVIDKPSAVQTEVRAGHLGVRRNQQDFMALNMTLRILGGEGANRLHQVLRTERGLTYGAKAEFDTLAESGDFEVSTNTRSEATGEVLRLIVDEFWRIRRERVGERELSSTKAYVTGSFPLTIETPDAIATQVLNVLFYGLPVAQLQTFRERVNAVQSDDIERVARFYLQPDRLAIVLVGNAAAFVPQLRGLGFTNVEVIGEDDLDIMAPGLRRARGAGQPTSAPSFGGRTSPGASLARVRRPALAYQAGGSQPVAQPGGPRRDEARQLLEQIVVAKGGIDRLRAIKSLTVTTRSKALGPNAPTETADTTTYLEYPNRVRVESRVRGTEVVQVFDGTRAWVHDPRGTHDVPEQMLGDFRSGLRRDTIALLVAAYDQQVRVRRLTDAKGESGEPQQVLEFSSADVEPLVMYVDPTTHLVTKQTYVAGGMGRPLVEERFSDYREVDGVQFTFAARVVVGGQPALERTVTSLKAGGALDPSLFKRPAD